MNPKQTAVEGEGMFKMRGDIIAYVCWGGQEGAQNNTGVGYIHTLLQRSIEKIISFPEDTCDSQHLNPPMPPIANQFMLSKTRD